MSFRQITILGNVGKDPVLRTVGDSQVASIGVAVSDWKNKNGETQTTWFDVSIWQKGPSGLITSVVSPHVKKGTMVFIVGQPEIQEYEKDGIKRRAFNIRVGGPGSTLRLCGSKTNGGSSSSAPAGAPAAEDNDDIPF